MIAVLVRVGAYYYLVPLQCAYIKIRQIFVGLSPDFNAAADDAQQVHDYLVLEYPVIA